GADAAARRHAGASGVIGIGVVGYGYWGPNLVRCFSDLPTASVRAVCDLDRTRLAAVERRYPGVRVTTDAASLIADPSVNAVVVATPVEYHFPIAMMALQAGKHVLVEKPIAASSIEAARLIEEAAWRRLV